MMTLVTADEKGRVRIHGTKKGKKYFVKEADGGWWVTPAPKTEPRQPLPRNRREWAGSKHSLNEHLKTMRDHGLRLRRTETARQLVPPCRF